MGNNPFALEGNQNVTSTITNALIGISVETNNVIDQLQPSIEAQVTNISSFVEFSTKMLQNFYNYVSSFSLVVPADGQQYVPLSTLQNWYTTFERRLGQNPNFWKNL